MTPKEVEKKSGNKFLMKATSMHATLSEERESLVKRGDYQFFLMLVKMFL